MTGTRTKYSLVSTATGLLGNTYTNGEYIKEFPDEFVLDAFVNKIEMAPKKSLTSILSTWDIVYL